MKHRVICRDYLCLENLDSICSGDFGELAQKDRAEPASLEIVGDSEGDLGALIFRDGIEGVTDNPRAIAAARNEPESLIQIRLSMSFGGQSRAVLQRVKPQPA
jgi:hypothetical protein